MRNLYCPKCKEYTPHKKIGREQIFEEDGPLIRTMGAIFTLGMSELCNNAYFYKCKCCGNIKSVKG